MNIFATLAAAVFLASFSVPALATAQTCTAAGQSCMSGQGTCDYNEENQLFCYVPTGQGVNNQYLVFYRDLIQGTVNGVLVPILIAIAFIVFLWGVFKYYIYGATDEAKRKDGHQLIIWGVIGFVVIVSVWGIVNIVTNILVPGTVSNNAPPTPRL